MSGILTLPDILEHPLMCMQILQPIQNVLKVCKKDKVFAPKAKISQSVSEVLKVMPTLYLIQKCRIIFKYTSVSEICTGTQTKENNLVFVPFGHACLSCCKAGN